MSLKLLIINKLKIQLQTNMPGKKDNNPPGDTPSKLNKTLNPINNLDVTMQQRNIRRPRNRPSLPRIATWGIEQSRAKLSGGLGKDRYALYQLASTSLSSGTRPPSHSQACPSPSSQEPRLHEASLCRTFIAARPASQ